MNTLLISSVQRYSLHDGPGIRTTVFFAGCPLQCPWCHNPECILPEAVILYRADKCGLCGACVRACPSGAAWADERGQLHYDRTLCTACGLCVTQCAASARELSAKSYTLDALVKLVARDLPFFEESGGGVTLSGGEVMAQDEEMIGGLLQALYGLGIAVNVDTCGYAPRDRFLDALPFVDTFLYDLKAFDSALHERLTGRDNRLILGNLKALSDAGAKIDLRIPVIGGANDGLRDWAAAADWLKRNVRAASIHLLPYHNTGGGKYARLGREARAFDVPALDTLHSIQALFAARGFAVPAIGG